MLTIRCNSRSLLKSKLLIEQLTSIPLIEDNFLATVKWFVLATIERALIKSEHNKQTLKISANKKF
jgi:hypothetical protein